MQEEGTDKLVEAAKAPDIKELQEELRRSLADSTQFTDPEAADKVRFCQWDGQSEDGKKWTTNTNTTVFPFEGASDTRIPLANQIIEDLTDLLVVAFNRSQLKVKSVEANDTKTAAAATTLVNWVRERLASQLHEEAELLANYRNAYGWAVAYVGWDQQTTLRMQKLDLNQIVAMSQQADPQSILAEIPALIANPGADDQTATILQGMATQLSTSEAKRVVRELRETGFSEFPTPYICRNQPLLTALRPIDEVVFPPETIDLQSARAIFRRQWLTEVELRSKILDEDWDEAFVEEAAKTAGKSASLAETELSSFIQTGAPDASNLIEIWWGYVRQIDKNGVPAIYYTVFSQNVPEKYGAHGLLDYSHNQYPFVSWKFETVARRLVDSRGVPAISATWQNEIKAQRDSIHDYTSFSTIPSIQYLKRNGPISKLGPAVQVPVTKIGDVAFMNPPPREPQTAFLLIQTIREQADAYFGRPNANIPPALTQAKQQRMVDGWLRGWQAAFKQVLQLCVQYMDLPELQRIVAAEAESLTSDAVKYDLSLSYNVSETDPDLVKQKLETISAQVVPLDVSGRIDRAKLVEKIVRAIAPESADDLLVDQETASQALYKNVQNDIALMMLGFEATYADASNDPTAPTKLQYAQQMAQANPQVMRTAQVNPQVAALYENYMKNLMMGSMQQANKQIGRIGVSPIQQPGPPATPEAPAPGV
jgi:hypothetical protein